MNKVDFIIPAKPRLVNSPDTVKLPRRGYPSPPPHRINTGNDSQIFSRKRKQGEQCSGRKVSDAPPHTKFTVIPSRAITDPRINTRKPLLLLLGAIGIHASAKGICYPSQYRLAHLCGKSRSWAGKYMRELQFLGYIRKLTPPYPMGSRSAWRIQVLWRADDPLPKKESDWNKSPWCW